jgi:hypothetical protein
LHYISKDTTVTQGTKVVVGIISNTQSLENLKRLQILGIFENFTTRTIIDTTFNSNSFNNDIAFFTYPNPGDEYIEITLWDKNEASSVIGLTITTGPAPQSIIVYNDKILGAQASLVGAFFATQDGSIYNLDDAKLNSEKIDFLYFYTDTYHATLSAPEDADAALVYTGTNGLETWTTLNSTKFKVTTLSSSQFNDIQTANQIVAIAAIPAPNQSKVTDLTVGKVLAFKTEQGLFGLIRIDAISGANSSGTLEITVKIQN